MMSGPVVVPWWGRIGQMPLPVDHPAAHDLPLAFLQETGTGELTASNQWWVDGMEDVDAEDPSVRHYSSPRSEWGGEDLLGEEEDEEDGGDGALFDGQQSGILAYMQRRVDALMLSRVMDPNTSVGEPLDPLLVQAQSALSQVVQQQIVGGVVTASDIVGCGGNSPFSSSWGTHVRLSRARLRGHLLRMPREVYVREWIRLQGDIGSSPFFGSSQASQPQQQQQQQDPHHHRLVVVGANRSASSSTHLQPQVQPFPRIPRR